MYRRHHLVLALLPLLLALAAGAKADDAEKSAAPSRLPTPLGVTKILTLVLEENGQSYSFSMPVASREFSLALGDKNIRLRGQIRRADENHELVDYTLEFARMKVDDNGTRQRVGSTWRGSTLLAEDATVEIATFLDGSFTLHWKNR